MSKLVEHSQEEERPKMGKFEDAQTDVLVDDYKDMEIDVVPSTREQRLGWNKYAIDKLTGFNDYD